MADMQKDSTPTDNDHIDERNRQSYHRSSSGIDVCADGIDFGNMDKPTANNTEHDEERKGSKDSGLWSPYVTPKASFEYPQTPPTPSKEQMNKHKQMTDELKAKLRSQSQGEIQVKRLYEVEEPERKFKETNQPAPCPHKADNAPAISPLNRAQTLPNKSGKTLPTVLSEKKSSNSFRLKHLTKIVSFRRRHKPKPLSLTQDNISDSESHRKKMPSTLRRSRSMDDLDDNDGYDLVTFPLRYDEARPEIHDQPKSAGFLVDEYEQFNFDFQKDGVDAERIKTRVPPQAMTRLKSEADGAYENVENLPIAAEDEKRYSQFGFGETEVRLPPHKTAVETHSKQSASRSKVEKPTPKPRQNVPASKQRLPHPPSPRPAAPRPLPAPSTDENCQMALQAIQNIMARNPQEKQTEIVIQTINFVAKYCDAHGGYLEVGSKKATLFIPPFALDGDTPVLIYIQIEETYCVIGGEKGYQIAPVIHCGISGTQFKTPVILNFLTSIQDERYFNITGLRKETADESPKNASSATATDGIATKGVRRETVQSGNVPSTEWHETNENEGQVISLENGKCTVMLHHFTNDTAAATPKEVHFGKISVIAFTSPVMKKGNIFDIRVWMSSNQETLREDERREREDNHAKQLNDYSPTLCLFEDGGDVIIAITKLDGRWSLASNCSKTENICISKLRHDFDDQGIRESRVFRIHPAEEFDPNATVSFDIELFQQHKKEFGVKIQVCVEPELAQEGATTNRPGQNRPYRAIRQSTPWMPTKGSLQKLERSLFTNDNWKPLAAWLHLDMCHLEKFPNPATMMLSMVYNKHAGPSGGDYIRNALEEIDTALSTGKLGLGLREASDIVKDILGGASSLQTEGGVIVRQPTEETWPVSTIEVNEYRFGPTNPYGYRTLESFNRVYTAADGAVGGSPHTMLSMGVTPHTRSPEPVQQGWPLEDHHAVYQVDDHNRQATPTELVPKGLPEEQRRKSSSGYCTIAESLIDPNRPQLGLPTPLELHYDQPYSVGGSHNGPSRHVKLHKPPELHYNAHDAVAVANHLGDGSYDLVGNPLRDSVTLVSDVDLSQGMSLSQVVLEEHQDPPYVNVVPGTKPKQSKYLQGIANSKVQHKQDKQ
ncbi:uncharacterized protein [Amphiura filiformis]|uniref:uncharacterized protein n=1 Tax=Amphiura filiformis TaxID=82378 RepID=UPI003B20F7C9